MGSPRKAARSRPGDPHDLDTPPGDDRVAQAADNHKGRECLVPDSLNSRGGGGSAEDAAGWPPHQGLTRFPISIVVFCDNCGAETEHDYVVHDLMTREQRLDVARNWLVRNEGWSCTAEGDFCPRCRPGDTDD